MATIGETLVSQLEARGVKVVFGIPGVHTVELYRGLADSSIRHITPRHEQAAGFMADGYARVSGQPGVAFVITGPGLTNTLTPMAQARADSIPMLVISSVNSRTDLGKGLGHLHELPDQHGLAASVAISSTHITKDSELIPTLDDAFELFTTQRGGPVHIEIPLDVMAMPFEQDATIGKQDHKTPTVDIDGAIQTLKRSKSPLILAGGGSNRAEHSLIKLAECLDAPVILTVNGRGLMHDHPLCIPASPSLDCTRELIQKADTVLAIGTELGPTDYDIYSDGKMPTLSNLIRIDVSSDQLGRHAAKHTICGCVENILPEMLSAFNDISAQNSGPTKAKATRKAALDEIGETMRSYVELLETIRDSAPNSILVGDSTQPIYAGGLYYDHDRPNGWFNAATGYGALGYGIPAAMGAALADPDANVICLVGDGGAQFSLPELMVAIDENLPVLFIIWNNDGYGEIETSMESADVTVVGCDPTPPDFEHIAKAYKLPYQKCGFNKKALFKALDTASNRSGPEMIEIVIPK